MEILASLKLCGEFTAVKSTRLSFTWLFAEERPPLSAVPPLIGRMVAIDAFSQAFTNPLLSEHIFNEATFTPEGFRTIKDTSRLEDLLKRNIPHSDVPAFASMWQQQSS
jgi:prostaglandin-endoperoxide synthase 2